MKSLISGFSFEAKDGRAPQGARGLKCNEEAAGKPPPPVAPRKGRVD